MTWDRAWMWALLSENHAAARLIPTDARADNLQLFERDGAYAIGMFSFDEFLIDIVRRSGEECALTGSQYIGVLEVTLALCKKRLECEHFRVTLALLNGLKMALPYYGSKESPGRVTIFNRICRWADSIPRHVRVMTMVIEHRFFPRRLARRLFLQGAAVPQISRILRVSEGDVQRWIRPSG